MVLVSGLFTCAAVAADQNATPFKLGTFRDHGREFLGLVLEDTRVIDIAAANKAFERAHPQAPRVRPPAQMTELIARYEEDIGPRLRQLAAANAGAGSAGYVHAIASLDVLPPVRPAVILNAGANYPEHAQGIVEQAARAAAASGGAGGGPPGGPGGAARQAAVSKPGLWERSADDPRPDNPYLFLKSPSVMVGANDDVIVPRGREEIDWECEFAVVVGRTAKDVTVADAPNHVFGYSIEFDVSDRENRGDRKMGGGPDWFVQKNHDTFAPVGPFIVPKEFVPAPMNTRHYFTLNGEVKQDSNTNHMEYNIWEMLAYASNVMTLRPGDLISMGTPPGTNIEKQNPRWMKPGDLGVCVVEGVGEQRHHIVAQP
ncbi:MAG TPA: fumarylacetoacetate hydrolase family protein [Steroidobacteraceae bacterium]|nr:fumarylacetoacetate hydrolase family protein [Steroidobacteraceae bacterium]